MGCTQVALTSLGEGWWTEERQGGASLDLPRKHAFCPVVIPGQPLGYGTEGLVQMLVPFAHGDIIPFSCHCLVIVVKVQVVLPTVPGLVLVGEVTVEREGLVVLDCGLDVFCHDADS